MKTDKPRWVCLCGSRRLVRSAASNTHIYMNVRFVRPRVRYGPRIRGKRLLGAEGFYCGKCGRYFGNRLRFINRVKVSLQQQETIQADKEDYYKSTGFLPGLG